ncbi:MAG: oxygenase MpaB family protein [Granulosicoccus sp.]
MSRWAKEIEALNPTVDTERIYFLLTTCEFSWDIEKALEFALFRTYAVPSISGLLSATREFHERTRKRYDDTELLLSEIAENGQDSERGQLSIARINAMHGRYRISNDDFLYVLSTFIVQPVRWLERFGKRAMTRNEIDACVAYYRSLGTRMEIRDIPENLQGFVDYHDNYEASHFSFAKSNAEIGSLTRDLLLSMYLPQWCLAIGRPAVHALCDPPLRTAMGFPDPPHWIQILIPACLRLRARLLQLLPARRKPHLITQRRRPTYPDGYRIIDLGTFK